MMAEVKVIVPFIDLECGEVFRDVGTVYECTDSRANTLVGKKLVEIVGKTAKPRKAAAPRKKTE